MNSKDNLYKESMNMEKNFFYFPRRISGVCSSLFCYSTMSKLLPSIVRDTRNNLLVIFNLLTIGDLTWNDPQVENHYC